MNRPAFNEAEMIRRNRERVAAIKADVARQNCPDCPKCGAVSPNSWAQCLGECPMARSPHYTEKMHRRFKDVESPPADMTDEQQRLCLAYCEAARVAQTSLTLADCHAAGQGWKVFMAAYAPVPEQAPGVLPKPLPGYGR